MSDEEKAFLLAICATPADDAPRLVFADWLDEHNQPERAEFIRLQVEAERVSASEREALRQRAFDLWMPNSAIDPPKVIVDILRECSDWVTVSTICPSVRRGFLTELKLPESVLLEHAATIFSLCPIEKITLTNKRPTFSPDIWHNTGSYRAPMWERTELGVFCFSQKSAMHEEQQSHLDKRIFRHLQKGRKSRAVLSHRYYELPREEVEADLSQACVSFGRISAKLPSLSPKVRRKLRHPKT